MPLNAVWFAAFSVGIEDAACQHKKDRCQESLSGIDGSGHSQRALEWAAREAALRQVPLAVVTVHHTVVNYLGSTVSYAEDDPLTERARKAAQQETDKGPR
jgi:nucleotide-binding universal stress UspA family protein